MDALIGERTAWLLAAAAIDICLGELPNAVHPVAWFGRVAGFAFDAVPRRGRAMPFVAGALLTLALTAVAVLVVRGAQSFFTSLHPRAGDVFAVFILQSTFAARALLEAGNEVGRRVRAGATEEARQGLTALCSRDPSSLDSTSLLTGATESVAENASDSVVAPLLAYVLFGLPGAVAYRCLNTLDAMFGYRDHREWLGKTAARLDDLLNLAPARITAGLMLVGGACLGHDPRRAARVWWRDRATTPSPNGGHPMAMMAGLVGARLDKPGVYVLGAEFPAVDERSLAASLRIVTSTFVLTLVLALLGTELLHGG